MCFEIQRVWKSKSKLTKSSRLSIDTKQIASQRVAAKIAKVAGYLSDHR